MTISKFLQPKSKTIPTRLTSTGISIVILAGLAGCSNTTEGAEKDLHENSIKASQGLKKGIDSASNAAVEAKDNLKDASSQASLTIRIKNAINADKDLNDKRNVIDVSSTKDSITLTGHVYSENLKERAKTIANEEMMKVKASQILKVDITTLL